MSRTSKQQHFLATRHDGFLKKEISKARHFVTIVLRGCIMRVRADKAPELQRQEQFLLAEDWGNNRL